MFDLESHWYRRFWALSLLAGIEEAGASPIDLKGFNILAYLANAVATCYNIPAIDETVLKERKGPLYPALIWDLDRLVGMRLASVSDVVVGDARTLRNVSYSITAKGIDILTTARMLNSQIATESESLVNVAIAFARNRNHINATQLISADGNYADDRTAIGSVIDFGKWHPENTTANSVAFILERVNEALRDNPTVGVNLYLRYLANASIAKTVEHE
jgi:hypothetical protein